MVPLENLPTAPLVAICSIGGNVGTSDTIGVNVGTNGTVMWCIFVSFGFSTENVNFVNILIEFYRVWYQNKAEYV